MVMDMMRPTFMLAACLPRLVSALSMTSSCSRELVWNISLTTATCLCCWVTRAGDTCTVELQTKIREDFTIMEKSPNCGLTPV